MNYILCFLIGFFIGDAFNYFFFTRPTREIARRSMKLNDEMLASMEKHLKVLEKLKAYMDTSETVEGVKQILREFGNK